MKMPFYQLEDSRDVIRQFTPNWFTVTMGTGVVALILPEFPFAQAALWEIATLLWQLNSFLFIAFSILYLLRWFIYPQEAKQIFSHPSMALFLGAIPMGLATVINGFLKFGIGIFGDVAIQIAHSLWYIDFMLAILIGVFVPFFMYTKQDHALHTMTAMWLLPIVACEVTATSAGLLLAHLPANAESLWILFASYMLWGVSVLPAFAVLSILMLRLALHKIPSQDLAITGWLALGPIGTGALALLVLGEQATRILIHFNMMQIGEFFHLGGIMASLILLGFGCWWFSIAILITLKLAKNGLPFNLGWWGLTFPLGVFTLAILNLAHETQVQFIHIFGLLCAAVLMLLWVIVMTKTLKALYRGNLFFSPCLKTFLEKQQG